MKYFPALARLLMLTLILSACGARAPQAAPTINPVDIQRTAAAVAFTMVAETQAAIPTATPPPPTATVTNTAAPTATFLALPSSAITLTPVPSGNSGNSGGSDPCVNKILPALLQGDPIKIRINNSTKATLTVSVYLNQLNSQNQCGYRSYTLAPEQAVVINDLVVGCYTVWAWNTDQKNYFIVTNGTSCLDTSAKWVFDITTRDINLRT